MFELENTIDIEKMVLSYNNPTLSKTIKFIMLMLFLNRIFCLIS